MRLVELLQCIDPIARLHHCVSSLHQRSAKDLTSAMPGQVSVSKQGVKATRFNSVEQNCHFQSTTTDTKSKIRSKKEEVDIGNEEEVEEGDEGDQEEK